MMDPNEHHIFLTPVPLSPRGEGERYMYVCDRVQESVIRRSSVLTALQETTGVVQLPNGISMRAFTVWKKAADGSAEPSVAELATVIRVCCTRAPFQKNVLFPSARKLYRQLLTNMLTIYLPCTCLGCQKRFLDSFAVQHGLQRTDSDHSCPYFPHSRNDI